MLYTSFLLNGAWEISYSENAYTDQQAPRVSGTFMESAVPGYWEDMTELFRKTPFFRRLKVNPEYGIQQYPITGTAPDMALPNIIGNFFYRRTFLCSDIAEDAVIYFDGVQNAVSVWLNDVFLGRHQGYSTPFEMEIPMGALKNGENTIILSVSNHRLKGYADEPVSGLTSRAANECTGGITGNVELRFYQCPLRDVSLLVSKDCRTVSTKVDAVSAVSLQWFVCDGGVVLKEGMADRDFVFDTEELELWSPENPKLYTLKIICEDVVLERSFGVRRLVADGVHFKLNGLPYYLRGICEHCYFPETIHPDHDAVYYRSIIKAVKNLGFNFIRFHTYIPEEEYMQAADELGMLVHVECPNNTSVSEWQEIVKFCRRHTSVVIYCCGNELQMDESFIAYLNRCADYVHDNTDALFSPLSALRGLEYCWVEPEQEPETVAQPFKHHPRRFKTVSEFSDMYSSYTDGQNSYFSLDCDPQKVDKWSSVYQKPRVSHEICIDGTYTDLSLKDRYRNLRVGKTDMFSSIERHLASKGLLKNAPLYFKNSSEWQRRVRKYCFESTRLSENLAGYDFLGPIDTHWHTFGYDVGMMNEFYELKPGETVRNVRMYNSPTVILNDLAKKVNFASGETLRVGLYTSHYGTEDLINAQLHIRLLTEGKVIAREIIAIDYVANGCVSKLYEFSHVLPEVGKPAELKLYVTLDGGNMFTENEWELYLFPKAKEVTVKNLVIADDMSTVELKKELESGKSVLLLGTGPFANLPTTFRISLAGRTSGNLATVIGDHPIVRDMPHDGFCGWQFSGLMEGGKAVCFECDDVPFVPIIEVVSTHKLAIRQSALFEYNALNGKLLVCSFHFKDSDPAANWLKAQLISYAQSEKFVPAYTISEQQFDAWVNKDFTKAESNQNIAFNPNDKTSTRS